MTHRFVKVLQLGDVVAQRKENYPGKVREKQAKEKICGDKESLVDSYEEVEAQHKALR